MQGTDTSAIFNRYFQFGTCGSGAEQGIDAMFDAISNMAPGSCNAGFLRPDANLVIIFVTDEDNAKRNPDNTTRNTPLSDAEIQQFITRLVADTKGDAANAITKIRLALIGPVNAQGNASRCRIDENNQVTDICGSLCNLPEPEISDFGTTTFQGNRGNVSSGDVVTFQLDENSNIPGWNEANSGGGCDSCTSYAVADCCVADVPGTDYVNFLRAFETRVNATDNTFDTNNCVTRANGAKASCLVDSICQQNFAQTLENIARQLVRQDSLILNTVPSYPEGITVQVVDPIGQVLRVIGRDDYTVAVLEGDRVRIDFVNTTNLPQNSNESIAIFYATETRETERFGACVPAADSQ